MSRIVLFLAVITVSASPSFGQDTISNYSEFTFQVGVTRILNQDKFQSPFTYRGTNIMAQVTYLKNKPAGQHQLELAYATGKIKSIVSLLANNRVFLLNYDYLIKIKPTSIKNKLALFLGGSLNSVAYSVNYHPDIESPVTYISASSALTLSGKLMYRITPCGVFTLQTAVPLLGINLRPDFEINGKTHAQLSYFGKNIWVAGKLEYAHTLKKRYQAVLEYQTSFFTAPEPKLLRVMQTSLQLGIKKKF